VKEQKEDRDYLQLKLATKRLLSTADGRLFIWHVLSLCEIYSDTFMGNSTTFYLEGKRAVGLAVLQLLEDINPTSYARLLLKKREEEDNNA